MRSDTIVTELRRARPDAPSQVAAPLEVCERILAADPADPVLRPRRRGWLRWSARTLALAAATLTLAGVAAAATLIAANAPAPTGKQVLAPTGFVAYWEHGTLARVIDCAKAPDAIECEGDRERQRAAETRILRAVSERRDRSTAVLFLAADGGVLSCAGAQACSYMDGEPNAGRPLPRIGASEEPVGSRSG